MVLSMACYATDGFDAEDDALNPLHILAMVLLCLLLMMLISLKVR